jgi:hypothetical protein
VTPLNKYMRRAVDGPRENRAAVLAHPGWEAWFLDLLVDASPCRADCAPAGPPGGAPAGIAPAGAQGPEAPPDAGSGEGGGADGGAAAPRPWAWAGPEAALLRSLLRALLRQALADTPLGWAALERAACHLRRAAALGRVGFGSQPCVGVCLPAGLRRAGSCHLPYARASAGRGRTSHAWACAEYLHYLFPTFTPQQDRC